MNRDPEKRKAYEAAYRAEHKDRKHAYDAAYRLTHKETRHAYDMARSETRRAQDIANADKIKADRVRRQKKLRGDALDHYGRQCACCGETNVEFLAIDHVNGGGGKHLREIGGNFYRWLRDNGFPGGFRTLCHNCNQSRGLYGYCPHEKERLA